MAVNKNALLKIPHKKLEVKDIHSDLYVITDFTYSDTDPEKCVVEFTPRVFSWNKKYLNFSDIENEFPKFSGEKFVRLLYKYVISYAESRVIKKEIEDEDGRKTTVLDWQNALENAGSPRNLHESRAVVSSCGIMFINAAAACRWLEVNTKQGDRLYKAVENKLRFKKYFWRYATKDEIEIFIE